MKKPIVVIMNSRWFWGSAWGAFLVFCAIVIPSLLVRSASESPQSIDSGSEVRLNEAQQSAAKGPSVAVYRTQMNRVEEVPLEDYVRGVVAAEMPIEFAVEALKAQSLAARTYIVRRLLEGDLTQVPTQDADVTDTIVHQAYISDDELRKKWGSLYESYRSKLDQAIRETEGMVLAYGGELIQAAFFSTSNGYTENSEDYWQAAVPYLRSVPSPWDKSISPKYTASKEFTMKDFLAKMELTGVVPVSTGASAMRLIDSTDSQRVKRIRIGGKTYTGRQVREKLGLASSHFTWKIQNGRIRFTTYGYGHGVGMSQYGAYGMALEGRSAEDIVKHYYTGIEIVQMESFFKDLKN
jgi:stage II sporulation protein D